MRKSKEALARMEDMFSLSIPVIQHKSNMIRETD